MIWVARTGGPSTLPADNVFQHIKHLVRRRIDQNDVVIDDDPPEIRTAPRQIGFQIARQALCKAGRQFAPTLRQAGR